ncbi:MAG: leucyl/phenylalanyl-tRNA--protein transferase [Gammaproteobacteria bacterium]|jgi:leucyl/phenylalanyl-tRNA--protein transferase
MQHSIHWLRPDDPPDSFPDVAKALRDPDGLLAIGGNLTPERIILAYRRGIFPWYDDGQPIMWWSPDPRAVIFPDEFHISRSLRRTLRKGTYSVSIDQCFNEVISQCANSRFETGTWITDDMLAAYRQLHELGHAHSVETWRGDQLVGGMYGIAIGKIFFGESMYSAAPDASKVALARLVHLLQRTGVKLLDCQVVSEHLLTLGMRPVPRKSFIGYLDQYVDCEPVVPVWGQLPAPTTALW